VSFDDADAYASMGITINDEYGVSETHSWNSLIDPAFNGTIYFASASVTTLTNPVITNQHYYDVRNVKAAIFGHSFVEAWTLRPQRQNTFANLIGQAIGRDIFMIYGLGGDTVSGVSQNIQTCKDFIANAEYVLLCVGRNDGNLTAQDFETAILSVIGNLEDMNIVPILFTIEPDANGYASQAFPTINEWIRNSGYHYVDMDKVFHNPDGTINTTLYIGDNQHPNADGHLRIFNRVKFDCPFLF
jgi:lysophospholipase L1-like esterase